jgi:hypothetical protein
MLQHASRLLPLPHTLVPLPLHVHPGTLPPSQCPMSRNVNIWQTTRLTLRRQPRQARRWLLDSVPHHDRARIPADFIPQRTSARKGVACISFAAEVSPQVHELRDSISFRRVEATALVRASNPPGTICFARVGAPCTCERDAGAAAVAAMQQLCIDEQHI